ncbi:hypothetical protein DM455_07000 [Legionella pneumophila]|nr:hypothetical protein DM454_10575 [Legionella pneumophila]PYB50830.1 hypothetical protein DM456_09455 [Legionella pneumophila]PYB63471.1 hypothetical protein DM455_07000 [Legionella pneumophila]TID59512.1 hypothetical protein DIZ40_08915 [Legionella pneumophila]TID61219.1 hypothetical protein DIZ38_06180 [Legionella pneumophila]
MGIVGSEVNHSLFCGENEALIRGEKNRNFQRFFERIHAIFGAIITVICKYVLFILLRLRREPFIFLCFIYPICKNNNHGLW